MNALIGVINAILYVYSIRVELCSSGLNCIYLGICVDVGFNEGLSFWNKRKNYGRCVLMIFEVFLLNACETFCSQEEQLLLPLDFIQVHSTSNAATLV